MNDMNRTITTSATSSSKTAARSARAGVLAFVLGAASVLSSGVAMADGVGGARVAANLRREAPAAAPSRVHFGWCDLYVPTFFKPKETYDLFIHFHGAPFLQEENVERAHLNAVVVSINMGISSGSYSNGYAAPQSFDSLLADTQKALDTTGRAKGARIGKIALSAWSAGFAAVGQILSQPANAERVDAVLLADGLHTQLLNGGRVYTDGLNKYATFAQRAMRGEKLFALTHSSIGTAGYASTTQSTQALLDLTSVGREEVRIDGWNGMRQIYEAHRGAFHVRGFDGTNEKAHIDHVKEMHETLIPYLRTRWQ